MRRPAHLVYGGEDRPPWGVMLLSGLQHVVVVTMFFVYPLIVMREAGIAAVQVADILRVGMLVLALGTLLQALPRGLDVFLRLELPAHYVHDRRRRIESEQRAVDARAIQAGY